MYMILGLESLWYMIYLMYVYDIMYVLDSYCERTQ